MPSLVEFGQAVLEEKIFTFSLFLNYLPLEKGVALHLNKLESPSPKDALHQNLVEIGPVVLEKIKMLKVYRRTTSYLKSSL